MFPNEVQIGKHTTFDIFIGCTYYQCFDCLSQSQKVKDYDI